MNQENVAIRKRTQIAKANRTMFLWIAIASAIVGAAIVVSIFLFQKLAYTEKVLAKKQETVSTLATNIATVDALKSEIRTLDTNQALAAAKANPSDQALQVILDALPAEANSLALGASLQNKLLSGIPGNLRLDSLQVDPVVGIEVLSSDGTAAPVDPAATGGESSSGIITFQFTIIGDQAALKAVLQNLEKSIRTIQVNTVRIEAQGNEATMSVQAQAYFEPAKNPQLIKEEVK